MWSKKKKKKNLVVDKTVHDKIFESVIVKIVDKIVDFRYDCKTIVEKIVEIYHIIKIYSWNIFRENYYFFFFFWGSFLKDVARININTLYIIVGTW